MQRQIEHTPIHILELPYDIYSLVFCITLKNRVVIKRRNLVCKQWKRYIDQYLEEKYSKDVDAILKIPYLFNTYAGTIETISLSLSKYPKMNNNRLRQCTSLTSLTLDYNCGITDEGLVHLTRLKELIVYDARDITHKPLSNLTNLTKLDLNETLIEICDLDCLINIKSLLLGSYCCVIEMDKLTRLSKLEELSIDHCLPHEPIYLPQLKRLELTISGDNVSNSYRFNACHVLQHLTNLEYLSIDCFEMDFTAETFQRLSRLKEIEILRSHYKQIQTIIPPNIIVNTVDDGDDW